MAYNYPNINNLMVYGTGADGDLTLTSSTYTGGPLSSGTLTRDAHFKNLTISGSGQIKLGVFRLFVSGVLDVSGATGVAILPGIGSAGNNATTATGAAPTSLGSGGTYAGNHLVGLAGANGTTGAGANASPGSGPRAYGGLVITSGKGGNAGATLGGNGAVIANQSNVPFNGYQNILPSLSAGVTGNGGGGGAGAGGVSGGGGGGGGQGGYFLFISCNKFNRSSSNVLGTIQSNGFNGGNGANSLGGNAAGGGGGSAGGGGFIVLYYNELLGTSATNLFQADGGNGGNGGNGTGTGEGGTGGGSGGGGQIYVLNLSTGASLTAGISAGSLGSGPTGTTGGTGATGAQTRLTL